MTAFSSCVSALARSLVGGGYHFTPVTPATHARVIARPDKKVASNLVDVFGWNVPFEPALLPGEWLSSMHGAELLEPVDQGRFRSLIRFATIGERIFAHSKYPTEESDAVFFGPDTVRFLDLVEHASRATRRLLDVGTGSGAAGIALAKFANKVVLSDINPRALAFAEVNAEINGVEIEVRQSDLYQDLEGSFDFIVANPPYLVDDDERVYRHGGGSLGIDLALRIVREGVERLDAGGRLVLYTGVPICSGHDPLRAELSTFLDAAHLQYRYRELDPDVFGEELENEAYRQADRIAVIGCVIDR